LWRSRGVQVGAHLCHAGPEDRPFEEQHRSSTFAFVMAGSFEYRTRAGTASLGAGAVLIGRRGEPFECSHRFGRGDRCLSFGFSEAALDEVRSASRGRRLRSWLPAGARSTVLLGAARAAERRGDGAALEEIGWTLAAMALGFDEPTDAREPTAQDRRRAADAMRFVDEHAGEPLSLDAIAGAVGASPYHFLRGFRAVTGVTPHQYLLSARLGRAADALASGENPITDVAFDSGFGDLSNFIRTFRRAAGCSPSAFRRRHSPVIWMSRSWYAEAGCSVSRGCSGSSSPAAAATRRNARSRAC
jgi:AraC-like DNA-binding protein